MRSLLLSLKFVLAFTLIGCSDTPGLSPVEAGEYTLTLRCGGEEAEFPATVQVDWDKAFNPITIEREGDSRVFGTALKNDEGRYDTDSRMELHFNGAVKGAAGRSALLTFAGDCASKEGAYECGGSCFGAAAQEGGDEGKEIDDPEGRLIFEKR